LKVILICASTVCGRIGPIVKGSAEDRRRLERMRAETDASLMGAGTLRAGNPEMRGPGGEIRADRIRAIITGSGRIPVAGKKIFSQGPQPVIFTKMTEVPRLEQELGGRGRVIGLPAGPAGLSIGDALAELGRLGAESVLIEGGGKLNHAAFCEGVVDELLLTITPYLSGDRAAASLLDGDGPVGLTMEIITCRVSSRSGEIFLHYRVR